MKRIIINHLYRIGDKNDGKSEKNESMRQFVDDKEIKSDETLIIRIDY